MVVLTSTRTCPHSMYYTETRNISTFKKLERTDAADLDQSGVSWIKWTGDKAAGGR